MRIIDTHFLVPRLQTLLYFPNYISLLYNTCPNSSSLKIKFFFISKSPKTPKSQTNADSDDRKYSLYFIIDHNFYKSHLMYWIVYNTEKPVISSKPFFQNFRIRISCLLGVFLDKAKEKKEALRKNRVRV